MSEIVNGNSVNETHANVNRSRSTFPLKQVVMDTHRFGEYHPHLVIDGVTSDKQPWRSSHDARSYTLKAPLMQDIQMHKDYFMVRLRAILPLNADKIITNPSLGDDVPSDAYCNISNFLGKIHTVSDAFHTYIQTLDPTDATQGIQISTYFVKWMIFLESVFSNGSLLASLGCNLNHCLDISYNLHSSRHDIDRFLDDVVALFKGAYYSAEPIVVFHGTDIYHVSDTYHDVPFDSSQYPYMSWHEFLQRIRDDADWSFSNQPIDASMLLTDVAASTFTIKNISGTSVIDLDVSRLWAYHLSCAAFYTDDKVDYIYSAEMFRSYIFSLLRNVASTPVSSYFSYNGHRLPYDYLSAKYFDMFVTNISSDIGTYNTLLYCYQYFLTLFGYHRSLRFKDYFTGSRTRPLAVGNTSIPVVSNQVSVIDVSRNIQIQRFLNAVQSTGRKFEEYLKGIFGVAPSPDHHNPIFLAHTSDSLFASEVENTGAAQQTNANSVTAVFRGNGSQYEFSVDVDEPCIILGITSYDIERCYVGGIERSFFKKDRYDMFLPELQYVGDQPVYSAELSSGVNVPTSAFGYQYHDMQFKQLVNRAVGGFAQRALPGYAFMFDAWRNAFWNPRISPDFIRSKNVELDEFYLSLSGYSLGTYFHFIVVNTNLCNASRPMAYNPQILG